MLIRNDKKFSLDCQVPNYDAPLNLDILMMDKNIDIDCQLKIAH